MSAKQIFYLLTAAAIYATLISVLDWQCNRPSIPIGSNNDSLIWANKALEIQYGMMSAEAQAQGLRAARAEMLARERDTVYLTRIRKIYVAAPDTCQPYLLAMQSECDTLVLAHVNSGLAKDTLIDTLRAIVANRNEVIRNDSVVKEGLQTELNQSAKDLKRERNGKRAAIGLGIAMFLIWLGVQVGG